LNTFTRGPEFSLFKMGCGVMNMQEGLGPAPKAKGTTKLNEINAKGGEHGVKRAISQNWELQEPEKAGWGGAKGEWEKLGGGGKGKRPLERSLVGKKSSGTQRKEPLPTLSHA